jgi:hypothetical protein
MKKKYVRRKVRSEVFRKRAEKEVEKRRRLEWIKYIAEKEKKVEK